MFGSSVIEIAIGLSFIFLLLSLISSAMVEIVESILKNRATDLERGIRELFNQEGGGKLAAEFYNHPLINGLYRGLYQREDSKSIGPLDYLKPTNLPSYIPAKNFASAVLDIVLHPPGDKDVVRDDDPDAAKGTASSLDAPPLPASMQAIRSAIRRNFGSTQVGRALRTMAEQSGDDVNALRANVETWFNGSMDRVSGAYKRRTQWVIFVIGLVLAVALDANTITITQRLATDSTLRSVVVNEATAFANKPNAVQTNAKDAKTLLTSLALPIGRPDGFQVGKTFTPPIDWWQHFFMPLLGWLLTAGAVSLGAPFWFDLLNKFMVIRATVKPHEKSLEEGSEDRQETRKQPLVITQGPAPTGGVAPAGGVAPGGNGSHFGFTPEPQFTAAPDAPDNESDLDEGDLPIETVTADDTLPPAEGGVG